MQSACDVNYTGLPRSIQRVCKNLWAAAPAKRATSGLLSARARSSAHSSRSAPASAAASSLGGRPLPAAAAYPMRPTVARSASPRGPPTGPLHIEERISLAFGSRTEALHVRGTATCVLGCSEHCCGPRLSVMVWRRPSGRAACGAPAAARSCPP